MRRITDKYVYTNTQMLSKSDFTADKSRIRSEILFFFCFLFSSRSRICEMCEATRHVDLWAHWTLKSSPYVSNHSQLLPLLLCRWSVTSGSCRWNLLSHCTATHSSMVFNLNECDCYARIRWCYAITAAVRDGPIECVCCIGARYVRRSEGGEKTRMNNVTGTGNNKRFDRTVNCSSK